MNETAWQHALLDAITTPQWQPDPRFPAGALAVYRNNYRVGLMEMLALVYPICRQLLGEEFFEALSREYVKATPSASGNLHRYGGGFADFVAAFEHTAHIGYLSDVARLEWALHRGYYAADSTPLAVATLAAIPQPQWGSLRFACHPACAVLDSRWPLADIHAHHQPATAGCAVDLATAQPLLLWRNGDGLMQLHVLAPGQAAFCQALLDGATLDEATSAGLAATPDFDLQAALLLVLQHGVLSAIKEPS